MKEAADTAATAGAGTGRAARATGDAAAVRRAVGAHPGRARGDGADEASAAAALLKASNLDC